MSKAKRLIQAVIESLQTELKTQVMNGHTHFHISWVCPYCDANVTNGEWTRSPAAARFKLQTEIGAHMVSHPLEVMPS